MTKKKIIIAIDGAASTGKSTLAKDVAKQLNYIYIDTGAMYRAVTYYFIRQKIDYNNVMDTVDALQSIKIKFKNIDGLNTTLLNDEIVENEIRTMEVSNLVSEVAKIKSVRNYLVSLQRIMSKEKGVVMDGRDIGTVVFPDAELKIFVTANENTRVKRRFEELKTKGFEVTEDEVKQNINLRDSIDSTRAISPLKKADDAIELDNSYLNRDQQLAFVLKKANEIIGHS